MTCDTCPEPAAWAPDGTTCMRAHCGECVGRCVECQDAIADDIATERALEDWRGGAA